MQGWCWGISRSAKPEAHSSLRRPATPLIARPRLGIFLELSLLSKHFRFPLVALLVYAASSTLWAQSLIGEVVAIADGDTLTVLDANRVQHKIRLAGIDAPERNQPFGQRSRQLLSDLVFRKQVEVIAGKKDRYGRTIGKVVHQQRDINLVLVSEGMAWHYKQYAREQDASDRKLYASRAGRTVIRRR